MSKSDYFVTFENITTVAGAAVVVLQAYGICVSGDIILHDSASLDLTISRVLPGGEEVILWQDTGIVGNVLIGKDDFTPPVPVLSGNIKVTLANAGNHLNACEVHLTVL